MPDKLLYTILYKIVWSVERSYNDKFASVFVEFWNTENFNMDIVSRIPSTAPKIKTHLPHPPDLGRFSAQDAALFHPSAENTELGTRYDINCSYSSDKIKQILCFPLRPQMPGGIGQQTLPRTAAERQANASAYQHRKEIHHRRSDTGSAQRGQPQPPRQ